MNEVHAVQIMSKVHAVLSFANESVSLSLSLAIENPNNFANEYVSLHTLPCIFT